MKPFRPKKVGSGPEAAIQEAIIKKLRYREWHVEVIHGNAYQSGLPDLYATHSRWGGKWIEVKNPESYKFTPAQLETFPKLCANGSPVYVLISDHNLELEKILGASNWYLYLDRKYANACKAKIQSLRNHKN